MVDFMMQTHSVIGLLDDLLENVKHGDHADAQSHPTGPTRPGTAGQGAASPGFRPSSGQAANSSNGAEQQFRPEFTTAANPAAQEAARRGTTTNLNIDRASHVNPPPQTHKTPRMATINAFKMEVARHLIAFEQAVAAEQADLRGRILGASSEAAGLRADLRLIESDRARWAEREPVRRPASTSPDPESTAAPSTSSSTEAADASSPDTATPVDHGTYDNEAITEEEAAEFMDMISAAQQRVLASLACYGSVYLRDLVPV